MHKSLFVLLGFPERFGQIRRAKEREGGGDSEDHVHEPSAEDVALDGEGVQGGRQRGADGAHHGDARLREAVGRAQ